MGNKANNDKKKKEVRDMINWQILELRENVFKNGS